MFKTILTAAVVVVLCIASAPAQSVDEIVAKTIEANGGLDKMTAIKAIRSRGEIIVQGGMAQGTIEITQKRPNKFHVEIEMMGNSVVQSYDGEDAWMVAPPMMGGTGAPQDIPAPQREDFVRGTDFDGPLVNHKQKGHTLELVGKEDMDGTEVYKLKLTLKDGHTQDIYLDADRFVPLKVVGAQLNPMTGNDTEAVHLLGDYREVGGVLKPHTLETQMNGMSVMQITLTEVDINPEIADAKFVRPEGQ